MKLEPTCLKAMSNPVKVIGGGIAGLSAALRLQDAGVGYELHEASSGFGGKIQSSELDGVLIDAGADNFVTRNSEFSDLVERLGLASHVVHPISKQAPFVFVDGELHPLPGETYIGIPRKDLGSSFGPIKNTYIESPDEVLTQGSVSIDEVVKSEFTAEVAELLVNPLLGGVNAASIDSLDFEASLPGLYEQYRKSGSLTKVVNAIPKPAGGKVFAGLALTTKGLIDAIVAELDPNRVFLNSPIEKLSEAPTVLATPSFAANQVLSNSKINVSSLEDINYASVAQVTVTFNAGEIDLPDSSGVIFPTSDNQRLSAATFLSSKWQHYKDSGKAIVRLTTGKQDSGWDVSTIDDQELTQTLLDEFAQVVNFGSHRQVRVVRWNKGLPHYSVGHARRVREIRTDLTKLAPEVALAGAAYDGIGIPACWQSGVNAANAFI